MHVNLPKAKSFITTAPTEVRCLAAALYVFGVPPDASGETLLAGMKALPHDLVTGVLELLYAVPVEHLYGYALWKTDAVAGPPPAFTPKMIASLGDCLSTEPSDTGGARGRYIVRRELTERETQARPLELLVFTKLPESLKLMAGALLGMKPPPTPGMLAAMQAAPIDEVLTMARLFLEMSWHEVMACLPDRSFERGSAELTEGEAVALADALQISVRAACNIAQSIAEMREDDDEQ